MQVCRDRTSTESSTEQSSPADGDRGDLGRVDHSRSEPRLWQRLRKKVRMALRRSLDRLLRRPATSGPHVCNLSFM